MDDTAAIQQCRQGDGTAYRHLVRRYQSEAIGHALAIVGSREDALDVVQEAFLDAWRALDRFDTSRRFYPWLYVMLRNRCYKLLRDRAVRPALDLEAPGVLCIPAGDGDAASLNAVLPELKAEDREILMLKYLDGLTYDELAARLEIPRGTVMSRLYHARLRLRALLEKDGVRP